jgi:putative PIN family toxin of toxin-antitoxin system
VRLVLDTCVLVAAFRSRLGASRRLLNGVVAGEVQAIVNLALFFEYEAVLNRDEQMTAHGYSTQEIAIFLEALAGFMVCIPRMHWQVRPQLSDPADELVLEAAINGQAESIVTFNLRHFVVAAERYEKRVETPRSIIQRRTRP